ncbi:MAG: hypothetical protein IKS45_08820, partial [Thermoguttaceae bacterium]|nr:hypothetical protein [Thermoguttaceae bacterium]
DQRERVLANARQRGLGVRLRTAAARTGSPAYGGGLRPRPGKVFGCVAGCARDKATNLWGSRSAIDNC